MEEKELTRPERLPRIRIIGTGGTIAGVAAGSAPTTQYEAGTIGIEELIRSVPELAGLADISCEQAANLSSFAVTDRLLLQLSRRVNQLLNEEDYDGVVITHGTDTMEETAYFLHLTVKSRKPIVVTGSMRPATSISADGPLNLYNAVALAASPEAEGQGVMITLNDAIGSARDTTKLHTTMADAFGSRDFGMIGYMVNGKPRFYYATVRRHTWMSEFDVGGLEALPRADILYGYTEDAGAAVEALIRAGAKGIVHAGMGNGGMFPAVRAALASAAERGIAVVSASRTGSGLVTAIEEDRQSGFVTADNLNPQKARILLKLALTRSSDANVLQSMFDVY